MNPSDADASGSPGEIVIQTQPLYEGGISPLIYGDFIEFLNDLVPGMWAEMLEDRKFEGVTQPRHVYPPDARWDSPRWRAFTCGRPEEDGAAFEDGIDLESLPQLATYSLDNGQPYSGTQSARVMVAAGDRRAFFAGIEQPEIAVQAGQRLILRLYARTDGPDPGPIHVRLGRNLGVFYSVYAEAALPALTRDWTCHTAELICPTTDEHAVLSIGSHAPGTFLIDQVSLMPDDSRLGWRADVVEAIRALRPGLIRFGGSSLIYYDWRGGLAPRDRRAPFINHPWGNTETHDVGLFEFLQFCELVGAEPLICTNANSSTTDSILAEIEFCNGPADSPYGRRRAALGHAAPFGVTYWQIGNEQAGAEYEQRLIADARAIRHRYPDLVLLASYPSDNLIDNLSDVVDYVCPHLYEPCTAATEAALRELIGRIRRNARNKNLRLGVTEWNLTGGAWGWGRTWLATQYAALNAARMLQLFQRLGDRIRLANRSNMTNSCFSGILQTNRAGLYVTPTYHVQRAFATLSGDIALGVRTDADEALHVAATRDSRSGELTVSVVNLGPTTATRVVDVSACSSAPHGARAWMLASPSILDVNDWVAPQRVAPTESTLPVAQGRCRISFPPYSLTIVRVAGD